MGATFRSLAVRDFRLFVTGHTLSQIGTWMQRLAVIWAVFEITGSGVAVGVASGCLFGPALVLSPVAGLLADRRDRRNILIATKAGLTATAVLFAAVAFAGPSNPLPYFAISLLFGVVETFDIPARMSFVHEIVKEQDLTNAIGLHAGGMNISRVVGPSLSGFLISSVGGEWCFVVNAALSLAVLGSMLAIKSRPARHAASQHAGGVLTGFRVAWMNHDLRSTLAMFAPLSVFAMAFPVTLPLFAERSLDGGAALFAMLFAAISVGSMAGVIVVARKSVVGLGFLSRASLWTGLTMAALAASPSAAIALVAAIAVGAATMAVITGAMTVIQLNAPAEIRGRVLALFSMTAIGSKALGGLLTGWIVDVSNPRAAIALGAAVAAIVSVWGYLAQRGAPTGRAHRVDHPPAAGSDALASPVHRFGRLGGIGRPDDESG